MRTFKEILDDCNTLKEAKQAKYKRLEDDLSAFEYTAKQSKIPLLNHIYSRLVDKEGRVSNFLDEPIDDVADDMIEECMDSINYFAFCIMSIERTRSQSVPTAKKSSKG